MDKFKLYSVSDKKMTLIFLKRLKDKILETKFPGHKKPPKTIPKHIKKNC